MRATTALLGARAGRREGVAFDLQRERRRIDAITDRLGHVPRGVEQTALVAAGVPAFRFGSTDNVGTVMYLHGGAYVLGTGHQGVVAAHLCIDGGPEVISVDYRLAPEHPAPAAVDDAFAVYRDLESRLGASNIVIIGESAGGGLLFLLLQRLRDAGVAMPAAVAASFPWVDLSMSGASATRNLGKDMLVRSELDQAARWFAGDGDLRNPSVSALFGELHDLPPVYIAVGGRDLLLDDARQLAGALTEADVDVVLDVWPGAPHGFTAMPFAEGREHRRRLKTFVRDALTA